jgi:DNA-directed RNA polymerase subunit RPC12/RpoP
MLHLHRDSQAGALSPSPLLGGHDAALNRGGYEQPESGVFKCEACGSRFHSQGDFISHMRKTHFEEPKPLRCPQCEEFFCLFPSQLKHHLQVKHDVEVMKQACISWGIHGLPKVSLKPAIPYHFTTCGQTTLKRPYGQFRGGCLQGGYPVLRAAYYPLGYPMPYGPVIKRRDMT